MNIPCLICGPGQVVAIASKDRSGLPLRSVICVHCGLVWSDPRPPFDVKRYYQEQYRLDYKGVHAPSLRHVYRAGRLALQRLVQVQDRAPHPARLLDAGAGGGEFVWAACRAGWDAIGIEPHEGYRGYARRQYGVAVAPGFVEERDWPPGSFDVITMWHALEHCGDPFHVLSKLRGWLAPDGWIFVEVPNVLRAASSPPTDFTELTSIRLVPSRWRQWRARWFKDLHGGNNIRRREHLCRLPAGREPG